MFKILFICENNSVLSPLAESLAKHILGPKFIVKSAGYALKPPHPLVRQVLEEKGIKYQINHQYSCREIKAEFFNMIIALTPESHDKCEIIPPPGGILLWDYSSWVEEEPDLRTIQALFDQLYQQIEEFSQKGIYLAFRDLQTFLLSFLDNLKEGVIVHDLKRKILVFNHAAEKITGIKRQNVIGHDCHEIFPRGFCREKCSFKDNSLPVSFPIEYPSNIRDKTGVTHFLNVSLIPLLSSSKEMTGVIASITDRSEEYELQRKLIEVKQFEDIIGEDPQIQRIFDLIRDLSHTNVPVIISGETGTGKEMVARAIHKNSPHCNGLFVPVNCGALPRGMLASELFGHVKGAYTGAIRDKKGRFEMADGGTLFLDEIGELPLDMQVALLRVLQDGTFQRLGSEKTIRVNVRIISATNQDLEAMVKKGTFREDLYYRLHVVPIYLPPLREREGDIPLLVQHFLETLGEGKRYRISTEALRLLYDYRWNGNIRQLQSVIRYAMITCTDSYIDVKDLPEEIKGNSPGTKKPHPGRPRILNEQAVRAALSQVDGNKSKAARILGVGRATLYRFLEKMDK